MVDCNVDVVVCAKSSAFSMRRDRQARPLEETGSIMMSWAGDNPRLSLDLVVSQSVRTHSTDLKYGINSGVAEDLSPGKRKALVFTSLGHFVNDGSGFFIPVIVAIFSALNGLSVLEVSILLTLAPLGTMVFSIFAGGWADRSGAPGRLMALGIACLGFGLVGFYLVAAYTSGTEFFVLAVLCDLVMGFGGAFYHPLGASILQKVFGHGTKGKALGVNGAMGSVGRATYPLILVAIAPFLTEPGGFAFFGVVGIGTALLIWMGLGRTESASEKREGERASVKSSLTKPMIVLLVVSFVRSASLFGVAQYAPTFLSSQKGLGTGPLWGVAVFVYYASAIVGQPLFGYLTDRLEHRLVLAISTLGAAGSIFGYVGSVGVESVAWLSLFGFFAYSGFPLLMALASDYSAGSASALGNSLVWGLGASGGTALGPIVVFALAFNDYSRLGISFEEMAIVAFVAGVAALLIPKPTVRRGRAYSVVEPGASIEETPSRRPQASTPNVFHEA